MDTQDHKAKWAQESARIRQEMDRLNAARAEITRRQAVLTAQRKTAWDEYIEGCRASKQNGGGKREQINNLRAAVVDFTHELANYRTNLNALKKQRTDWMNQTGIVDEAHPDLAGFSNAISRLLNEYINPTKKRLQLAQNKMARLEITAYALGDEADSDGEY